MNTDKQTRDLINVAVSALRTAHVPCLLVAPNGKDRPDCFSFWFSPDGTAPRDISEGVNEPQPAGTKTSIITFNLTVTFDLKE